jgi:hypothetical protein
MDRRTFLEKLGLASVGVAALGAEACKKPEEIAPIDEKPDPEPQPVRYNQALEARTGLKIPESLDVKIAPAENGYDLVLDIASLPRFTEETGYIHGALKEGVNALIRVKELNSLAHLDVQGSADLEVQTVLAEVNHSYIPNGATVPAPGKVSVGNDIHVQKIAKTELTAAKTEQPTATEFTSHQGKILFSNGTEPLQNNTTHYTVFANADKQRFLVADQAIVVQAQNVTQGADGKLQVDAEFPAGSALLAGESGNIQAKHELTVHNPQNYTHVRSASLNAQSQTTVRGARTAGHECAFEQRSGALNLEVPGFGHATSITLDTAVLNACGLDFGDRLRLQSGAEKQPPLSLGTIGNSAYIAVRAPLSVDVIAGNGIVQAKDSLDIGKMNSGEVVCLGKDAKIRVIEHGEKAAFLTDALKPEGSIQVRDPKENGQYLWLDKTTNQYVRLSHEQVAAPDLKHQSAASQGLCR